MNEVARRTCFRYKNNIDHYFQLSPSCAFFLNFDGVIFKEVMTISEEPLLLSQCDLSMLLQDLDLLEFQQKILAIPFL